MNGEEVQLDEADKSQIRNNLKKWKVNAQITAATTMVEFLGHLTFVIHLKLANGSNLASAIHFEAIYAILIPYSLLKNTSDNKNRIIEAGWKNIFKNILGIKGNSAVESSPGNDLSQSKVTSEVNDDSTRKQEPSNTNKILTSFSVQNNTKRENIHIVGETSSKIAASKGTHNKKIIWNSWFEKNSKMKMRNTTHIKRQLKTKNITDEKENEKRINANDIEILSVNELSND